jgi:hypothetical protein
MRLGDLVCREELRNRLLQLFAGNTRRVRFEDPTDLVYKT